MKWCAKFLVALAAAACLDAVAQRPSPPAPPFTAKGEYLVTGQVLVTNEYLQSANGRYFAILQADGNLCVYRGTPPAMAGDIWCYQRTGRGGQFTMALQADGNLCAYVGTPSAYTSNLWCSNTFAPAPAYLWMQGDGNLCEYRGTPGAPAGAIWCHNTNVGR